jgi:outer membrane protein OmpA-like peptidoglycan-associated protein
MLPMRLLILALLFSYTCSARQDSISVYFNLGSYQLNPVHKRTIDSLIYNDVLAPGRRVGIIGYADIIGSESSNKELSVKRANAVAAYLHYMGIDTQYIEQVTGAGEVSRAENDKGYPQDRKVTIVPGGFKKLIAIKPAKIADLTKVATNATVNLENILFYGGMAEFLPGSIPTLQALYETMRDNPNLKIQIEGHVCCISFYKDRLETLTTFQVMEDSIEKGHAEILSYNRAKAVNDYLIKNGIVKDRMRFLGFGISKPLLTDGKPNVHNEKNRRVEIRILAK